MFVSTLSTLPPPQILVTSVLSNFLCDACVGDDILSSANREITEHVEALNTFSASNPEVSISVAPPLPRSVPAWYTSYLPVFSTFLFHEISRMGNSRLKYLAPFVAPPTFFESDGIHLNSDAGTSFIHYLVSSADLLYPPVASGEAPVQTAVTEAAPVSLAQLSRDVTDLKSDFLRRRCQDNLVFARIKEDKDFEINKSREDRCTISGLTINTAPPQDPKDRQEFFKNLISELVTEALPDVDVPPQVLDVIVNMRFGRGPPFFEVKFDSVASSQSFRIAAAKLAKDGLGSFKGVFVSNTVNLSTRIRIDILKLIAKRLTTVSEFSYVQGFSSCPTLHYQMRIVDAVPGSAPPRITAGTGRSYTFAESVERWGHLLSQQSLGPVRNKALQAFSGCLEQYFVVLSDRAPEPEADIFSRLIPSRGRVPFSRGSRGGPRGGRPPSVRFRPSARANEPSLFSTSPSSIPSAADPKQVVCPANPDVEPPPVPAAAASALPVRDLKRMASPSNPDAEPSKKK